MSRIQKSLIILLLLFLVFVFLPAATAIPLVCAAAVGMAVGGFLAGSRDQATVKQARRSRETGAGMVQAFIDAMAEPVVATDGRMVVTFANARAVAAFSGLKTGQPLSLGMRDPVILATVGSCLEGAQSATADITDKVPIERNFILNVARLSPQIDPPRRGESVVVLMLRETTEQRRMEAMRVDFVANASHELRTPLASILGFVETLQGAARNDAGARERFLEIMATQARRMARLVDDLLSLSRIEMQEHIAPTGAVDLPQTIRQIADGLQGVAQERGVTLRLDLPEKAVVHGDPDELFRVFDNLVENAIKYGRSGGKVDVRVEAGAGDVAVVVKDYGPGIPAKHLPRLTERFYRVDSVASRAEGGTGLGLAIVKHIVSRHRGRLMIESREGEGATFTVHLPAAT